MYRIRILHALPQQWRLVGAAQQVLATPVAVSEIDTDNVFHGRGGARGHIFFLNPLVVGGARFYCCIVVVAASLLYLYRFRFVFLLIAEAIRSNAFVRNDGTAAGQKLRISDISYGRVRA